MGGNAFKHMELVRVARDDVPATVAHVVNTLSYPGFDYAYAMSALMGSSGKTETSGDIDFCMNTHEAQERLSVLFLTRMISRTAYTKRCLEPASTLKEVGTMSM